MCPVPSQDLLLLVHVLELIKSNDLDHLMAII
jgi:hypothetical protein